jgi:sugar phosphate permease
LLLDFYSIFQIHFSVEPQPLSSASKKGASTAAGVINGFGPIGAILGCSLPGKIADTWGWNLLFTILAVSVGLAGLILLPKWNAQET